MAYKKMTGTPRVRKVKASMAKAKTGRKATPKPKTAATRRKASSLVGKPKVKTVKAKAAPRVAMRTRRR